MDEEIAHWLELPAGTVFVEFSELPHLIAKALYPVVAEDEEFDPYYGGARVSFDEELPQAVAAGRLPVRDSLTHRLLTLPLGFALQSAVVKVSELRAFLAERGVGVRVACAPPGEPVPTAAESVTRTHELKRRGDALAAVLTLAKKQALDADSWQSVWASLVALAQSANRPAPLLGYTEGEGVKYQTDNAERPDGWLTREAYRARFNRQRPEPAASGRERTQPHATERERTKR